MTSTKNSRTPRKNFFLKILTKNCIFFFSKKKFLSSKKIFFEFFFLIQNLSSVVKDFRKDYNKPALKLWAPSSKIEKKNPISRNDVTLTSLRTTFVLAWLFQNSFNYFLTFSKHFQLYQKVTLKIPPPLKDTPLLFSESNLEKPSR